MRGYLVIHVGGYKRRLSNAGQIIQTDAGIALVPDRLIPAETHPFGTEGWVEDGWAVGDNPKDRFCKWHGTAPVRRFHDYDEAVAFIYRLRQKRKRPGEVYTLVYCLTGQHGTSCHQPVSSLADIQAFENEVVLELQAQQAALDARRQETEAEYPSLALLVEKTGRRNALSLSLLLKSIRENGMEQTKVNTPPSTFYRAVKELGKLGLLETTGKTK